MLLDGWFLLYFIHCVVRRNQSKLHGLNVKDYMITFVHQDLFLLENQLPFGVLKLIFEEVEFNIDGSPMQEMIKKFVIDTGRPEGSTSAIQLEEPSHLLDLLRSALLGGSKKSSKQEAQRFCCPWKKGKQQGNRLSFWHIKELKATGIHLKPSRTSSLTDISFNSNFFYGYCHNPNSGRPKIWPVTPGQRFDLKGFSYFTLAVN